MKLDLTIGWTHTEQSEGFPMLDGYKPGYTQHTETLKIEVDPDGMTISDMFHKIAEAAFWATNAPEAMGPDNFFDLAGQVAEGHVHQGRRCRRRYPTHTVGPVGLVDLPWQIHQRIAETGYRGQGAHYSLSVGDTVTIGEATLACESVGWKRVIGRSEARRREATA